MFRYKSRGAYGQPPTPVNGSCVPERGGKGGESSPTQPTQAAGSSTTFNASLSRDTSPFKAEPSASDFRSSESVSFHTEGRPHSSTLLQCQHLRGSEERRQDFLSFAQESSVRSSNDEQGSSCKALPETGYCDTSTHGNQQTAANTVNASRCFTKSLSSSLRLWSSPGIPSTKQQSSCWSTGSRRSISSRILAAKSVASFIPSPHVRRSSRIVPPQTPQCCGDDLPPLSCSSSFLMVSPPFSAESSTVDNKFATKQNSLFWGAAASDTVSTSRGHQRRGSRSLFPYRLCKVTPRNENPGESLEETMEDGESEGEGILTLKEIHTDSVALLDLNRVSMSVSLVMSRKENNGDLELGLQKHPQRKRNCFKQLCWSTSVLFGLNKAVEISGSRCLLSDITATFLSGRLVAVLGPSGAGKSTLLNILAGRVSHTDGEFCLKGSLVKAPEDVKPHVAFIPQKDLFLPNLTVEEHLHYQLELRLGPEGARKSLKEKTAIVEQLMIRFGLLNCKSTPIGQIDRGISGGERKRLSIASEILTNPCALIADEPTTGLDSAIAVSVVQTLRQLADLGKSVIVSLHQSSAQLFSMFDEVLLLSEGRIIYFGDRVGSLEWFNKWLEEPECPRLTNQAEYLVKCVSLPANHPQRAMEKRALIHKWGDHWSKRGDQFLQMWTERGRYRFFEESKSFVEREIEAVLTSGPPSPPASLRAPFLLNTTDLQTAVRTPDPAPSTPRKILFHSDCTHNATLPRVTDENTQPTGCELSSSVSLPHELYKASYKRLAATGQENAVVAPSSKNAAVPSPTLLL